MHTVPEQHAERGHPDGGPGVCVHPSESLLFRCHHYKENALQTSAEEGARGLTLAYEFNQIGYDADVYVFAC